jgi:hypothetical protein
MLSFWRMYEMHLTLFLKAGCDTVVKDECSLPRDHSSNVSCNFLYFVDTTTHEGINSSFILVETCSNQPKTCPWSLLASILACLGMK